MDSLPPALIGVQLHLALWERARPVSIDHLTAWKLLPYSFLDSALVLSHLLCADKLRYRHFFVKCLRAAVLRGEKGRRQLLARRQPSQYLHDQRRTRPAFKVLLPLSGFFAIRRLTCD